jgi:hypothetical protein
MFTAVSSELPALRGLLLSKLLVKTARQVRADLFTTPSEGEQQLVF